MTPEMDQVAALLRSGDAVAFARHVEPHRRELQAFCYRLLGSLHDAEDLVQESLLRAFRGRDGFEGRSSLRTWLYRIAHNACWSALESRRARLLPTSLGPPVTPNDAPASDAPVVEASWLEPYPEEQLDGMAPSPEARYSSRESIALAFLALLQQLPPKQRAVLVLRDVVGLAASEVAEVLELSVPSVNSALQRARETLAERRGDGGEPAAAAVVDDDRQRDLLERYVQVWERADVNALVALLREDAVLSMPPLPMWFRGAQSIVAAMGAMVLPPSAAGQFRLVPARASGQPSFAAYQLTDGKWRPMGIHVLRLDGHRIAEITAFLDATLFPPFGLPDELHP